MFQDYTETFMITVNHADSGSGVPCQTLSLSRSAVHTHHIIMDRTWQNSAETLFAYTFPLSSTSDTPLNPVSPVKRASARF